MKTILLFCSVLFITFFSYAQKLKKEQLIEPVELAKKLSDPATVKPVVFNIGPVDRIKTAIDIGSANSDEGMKKLKIEAAKISLEKEIVVYCGCCSSQNCPNIRPAIDYLTASGYKKAKVLNIPTGIKEDWVQKGYPVEK